MNGRHAHICPRQSMGGEKAKLVSDDNRHASSFDPATFRRVESAVRPATKIGSAIGFVLIRAVS